MRILKFNEYYENQNLAEDFINILSNPLVNEKNEDKGIINQILNKIFKDLSLNLSLIGTFGTGIAAMYPIVNELISNSRLNIDFNKENIILLTVTAIVITYLEEKKNNFTNFDIDVDEEELKNNAKSLLTELKLRGIGNGIVKRLVNSFKSIGNLLKVIFKNLRYIINGFIDMFSYTSILLPVMNAFAAFVDKYDLNMDTLSGNLLSIGAGIISIIAKNGINFIINRLSSKFKINKEEIMKDLPEPSIKKYPHPDYIDSEVEQKGDLIKGNENKNV